MKKKGSRRNYCTIADLAITKQNMLKKKQLEEEEEFRSKKPNAISYKIEFSVSQFLLCSFVITAGFADGVKLWQWCR